MTESTRQVLIELTRQELKELPFGTIITQPGLKKNGLRNTIVYQKTSADTFSVTLVSQDGSNKTLSGKTLNEMPLRFYNSVISDSVKRDYVISPMIAEHTTFFSKND